MASGSDIKASARVLTSEVLRCHGFEKNLQAISLTLPEQINYVLGTTNPHLTEVLPAEAKAYLEQDFTKDFERYTELSKMVVAKNAGKANAISVDEAREQVALKEKIRSKLTAPVVQAVLQDSGLFSADDFQQGRVAVSDQGVVTLRDLSGVKEENLARARGYIDVRQPTREADGSWKSQAGSRAPEGWASAKA